MGVEPKKLALLRILQILQKHSDYDHPLTQDDIERYLSRDYGIEMERKAIGRNVAILAEAGYDIESGHGGTYLASRDFEDSELRLLIDGVLQSRYITAKRSANLIERLCGLSSKYFRSHVKDVYSVNEWSKTENQDIFLNIDVISEAIAKNKQVQFRYYKYGVDGKLHPRNPHSVSPYLLVLRNQRYYLLGYNERRHHMTAYRIERISDIKLCDEIATPITAVPGYENGMDYKRVSSTMPYMYTDTPERVEFIADVSIADHVID